MTLSLKDIYYILNKVHNKFNCLQIVGPPTNFKSTFIKPIGSFMLNTGVVTKVNKHNVFSLKKFKDRPYDNYVRPEL